MKGVLTIEYGSLEQLIKITEALNDLTKQKTPSQVSLSEQLKAMLDGELPQPTQSVAAVVETDPMLYAGYKESPLIPNQSETSQLAVPTTQPTLTAVETKSATQEEVVWTADTLKSWLNSLVDRNDKDRTKPQKIRNIMWQIINNSTDNIPVDAPSPMAVHLGYNSINGQPSQASIFVARVKQELGLK